MGVKIIDRGRYMMSVNAVNHLHLAYLLSDGDDVTYKKSEPKLAFSLDEYIKRLLVLHRYLFRQ